MIKVIKENKKNKEEVIVIINDRNEFDEDGYSLEKYNSTEVDVYVDGIHEPTTARIGGSEFRHPDNIGKRFPGYMDSLGFVRIKGKSDVDAPLSYLYNPRYQDGDPSYMKKYGKYFH